MFTARKFKSLIFAARKRNVKALRTIPLIFLVVFLFKRISRDDTTDGSELAAQKFSETNLQLACKLPNIPLDAPEILKFLITKERITCGADKNGEVEQDWVRVRDDSKAEVTAEAKEKYGNIRCAFADITRVHDSKSRIARKLKFGESYVFEASDFVKVTCKGDNKMWGSFLAAPRLNVKPKVPAPTSSNPLNVLMWGFDSMSRNMFMRKLPSVYKYLTEDLEGIVLKGYNIVGDGTPQALIPILTGKTEKELPEARKRKSDTANYVNVYPFVWNEFRDKGYLTGYSEDAPRVGTFQYRLKGFNETPTDFYMRPYFVTAEREYEYFAPLCLGYTPRHKIMMNYARDILNYEADLFPKFVFSFHSELSHNDANGIQGAEYDILQFFKELRHSKALDNTILIAFSDHGNRFSSIRESEVGKQEERMPMFTFVFPPSFKATYKLAYENFNRNSYILSTPFDIHATLRDILNMENLTEDELTQEQNVSARSQSLFRPISEDRTCEHASIEPHWCACFNWESVPTTLPRVRKATTAFVDYINEYLREYTEQCELLSISQIMWAAELSVSKDLLRFKENKDLDGSIPDFTDAINASSTVIQLKVETLPGNGHFEVSLKHDHQTDSYNLNIDDISRINKYGNQASCVESEFEHLRKFCYCRTHLSGLAMD